jgi:hypothetical protein
MGLMLIELSLGRRKGGGEMKLRKALEFKDE